MTTDGGSDSTDFTPFEFSDYQRQPHHASSRTSGSSAPLYTGGGPYVARITVTAPTKHNHPSTLPVRDHNNHLPADRLMTPPVRQLDTAVQLKNNCDGPFKHPKTTKTDCSPTSPTDDRKIYNRSVKVLEHHNAPAEKLNSRAAFKHPETSKYNSCFTSPNRDGTLDLTVQLVPDCDSSNKRKKCGSPMKHPPKHSLTTTNNCAFNSYTNNHRHTTALPILDVPPTSQTNSNDVSTKQLQRPKNDSSSMLTAENHPNNFFRTIKSTAPVTAELEAPAWRKNNRVEHPPKSVDRCSVSASSDSHQTKSNSMVVGDSVAGPVRRKNGGDVASSNDEGPRSRNLSGKLTQRRSSAGDDVVVTKDASNLRCYSPGAVLTSNYCGEIAISSPPAANNVDVPSHGFRRADQKVASTNRHVTSRTSERSTEEDRRNKAKLAEMKRYCLEQLARPSKSMPEVARRRRRDNQQRKLAAEKADSPDSVHTLKSGAPLVDASAASRDKYSLVSPLEDRNNEGVSRGTPRSHEYLSPREYASRHRYSVNSTTNEGLHSLIPDHENSSEITTTWNTQPQQHSFRRVRSKKHISQTVDRRKGRTVSDASKRNQEVKGRPSPEEDTQSAVAARTNCSSASGAVSTCGRAGRLSVTITSNEPEPETQRTVDVGHTLFSLEAEHLRHSRRGSEEKNYSSSSEATVRGVYGRESVEKTTSRKKHHSRHHSRRTSAMSFSGQRCVDAAVQVELEELQRGGKDPASCPPNSEDSAFKTFGVQTSPTGSDRTATGQSPESESSSSKDYFRRSGKDVWRASMALHRSHRKDSADIHNENKRTDNERSKHSNRRRHRHSVVPFCSEQQDHPDETSSHNNRYEKTEEVVPAEIRRTTDTKWQNEMEKIHVEEKCIMTTAKGGDKQAELNAGTCKLLHNDDLAEDQRCEKNHEVQASTMQVQSPSAALNSSLIDVVVHDGCQDKESGNVANRISSHGVEEKLEKEGERAVTEDNRPGRIRQHELEEIGSEETSVMKTMKITKVDDEPRGVCHRETAEFPHNRDPVTNSDGSRSSPAHQSLSAALDASLVDVVVEDGSSADKLDMVVNKGAGLKDLETAEERKTVADTSLKNVVVENGHPDKELDVVAKKALQTVELEQKSVVDRVELSDHHRCDRPLRRDPTSMEFVADISSKSRRTVVTKACHGKASIITKREEHSEQDNPDNMAVVPATDIRPNSEVFCGPPSTTLLQHVPSPPEIASFFTRLLRLA